jgi:hypothetical protein
VKYDFIAIPDADVPQAVDPTFQLALTTYASETNKTVSVWRAVPSVERPRHLGHIIPWGGVSLDLRFFHEKTRTPSLFHEKNRV